MKLFDFLKRKKEVEKVKKGEKTEKKAAKKVEEVSVEKKVEEVKKEPAPAKVKSGKVRGFSYQAVDQPHISEKATYLSEKNQYIFKVLPNYNKKEIKNAVEGVYGVDVLSVNMVKIPAKKRRLGKTQGFKKGYKKAIVKIREGQKIEIL